MQSNCRKLNSESGCQPRFRDWPPPDRKSWQYIFTWGSTIVSSGGVFILGILDCNDLCNSILAGITGLLGIVCLILAPYTEEPWLMERFNDAYKDNKSQVPRFMSSGGCKDSD